MRIGKLILVSFALVIGANSYGQEEPTLPSQICVDFVKSLLTKDTVLFYRHLDVDSVTSDIKKKNHFERELGKTDIHVLFFLKYSPLKIRNELLEKIKSSGFSFRTFSIEVRSLDDKRASALVRWCPSSSKDEEAVQLFFGRDTSTEWKIRRIVPEKP